MNDVKTYMAPGIHLIRLETGGMLALSGGGWDESLSNVGGNWGAPENEDTIFNH
ncbi:MAG: hypothetical protein ACI4QG_05010 [Candidatus Cryptobacteroides sp.]